MSISFPFFLADAAASAAGMMFLYEKYPEFDNIPGEFGLGITLGLGINYALMTASANVGIAHAIAGTFFSWFFFPQIVQLVAKFIFWLYSVTE